MISAFFANSRTISQKTKNRKRVGREIGRPPEEHSVGNDSKADIKIQRKRQNSGCKTISGIRYFFLDRYVGTEYSDVSTRHK